MIVFVKNGQYTPIQKRALYDWAGDMDLPVVSFVLVDQASKNFKRAVDKWPGCIVALGQRAARAVVEADYECYSLPEPSQDCEVSLEECKKWIEERM